MQSKELIEIKRFFTPLQYNNNICTRARVGIIQATFGYYLGLNFHSSSYTVTKEVGSEVHVQQASIYLLHLIIFHFVAYYVLFQT